MNLNYHHTKDDLIKEFNLNYKIYLENLLLFQVINEIINEKKKIKNEKLFNRFWKSYLQTSLNFNEFTIQQTKQQQSNDSLTSLSLSSSGNSFLTTTTTTTANQFNSTTQCDNLINQLKLDDFDDDLKKEFMYEIEKTYENYLNKIGNIMMINIEEPELMISNKIKDIVYQNDQNTKQILKLNEDILIKLKSYLNLTHEIVNLLIKIINEYKLGFYLKKDLISFESLLFKCDMLLTKIETIIGECFCDTYSKEKLKCLNIIKENVNLNLIKSKEKYENMKNALKLYKSLGGEFELIHKDYIQLKTTLDQRKWTLNKLKNEIFY